jgi:hypothetical protein
MTLRQKQSLFVRLVGELIDFATSRGWEFTFGDAARMDRQGHMPNSLHYSRLAIDLNLFVNGRYIRSGENPAYLELGEFWESLDPLCAWGGRFGDANHFSLHHGGRR